MHDNFSKRSILKFKREIMVLIFLVLIPGLANARKPRYMKMNFEDVPALEIKGKWDPENGVFIASKIEELPKARRPKFRGEIQDIDIENRTITIYGIPIEIDDETQFSDTDETIKSLKVGQRIEISCKIRKDHWEAGRIKLKDVKDSNKIKGTITDLSIDGNPPDTLIMNGLKIILNKKTKIIEPTSLYETREDLIFADLRLSRLGSGDNDLILSDRITARAKYRQTTRDRTDYDLSQSIDLDNSDTEPEIRLQAAGVLNQNYQAFAQVRIRKKYFYNDNNNNPPKSDLDFDITQFYALARNIGNKGIALQIGRQDFDEPREWLFDEYLDAVRVYYYGVNQLAFEAAYIKGVSPLKDKFDTWTDIFWQARWMPDKYNTVKIYYLSRKDSDEIRNREPIWYGAGYYGKINDMIRLWADLSILRGEDKGKTQEADAIDLGATYFPNISELSPSVTISYAKGSGDKTSGDQISNEFRQTGYQDNVAYFGGVNSIYYYGELLDPELSNLIILTFATGIRPFYNMSAEMIYHKYKQNYPDNKFRSDLIGDPNSNSDDIGWELDFVLGFSNLWQRVNLSWITAMFKPGEAFGLRNDSAILNRVNLQVYF